MRDPLNSNTNVMVILIIVMNSSSIYIKVHILTVYC